MLRLTFFIACLMLVEAQIQDSGIHLGRTILNSKLKKKFKDCVDLRTNGNFKNSGLYYIYPNTSEPIKVTCRFERENTFTSIMGRASNSLDFRRYYADYEKGFGDSTNLWLGLAAIKRLTDIGHVNMRITMQDWSYNNITTFYKFSLGSRPDYRPHISYYQGPPGFKDDFSYNSGMPFATRDRADSHQCAVQTLAGWWYNYCTYFLPTGRYYYGGHYTPPGTMADGIFYQDWHGVDYSLRYIRIDLAPNP